MLGYRNEDMWKQNLSFISSYCTSYILIFNQFNNCEIYTFWVKRSGVFPRHLTSCSNRFSATSQRFLSLKGDRFLRLRLSVSRRVFLGLTWTFVVLISLRDTRRTLLIPADSIRVVRQLQRLEVIFSVICVHC